MFKLFSRNFSLFFSISLDFLRFFCIFFFAFFFSKYEKLIIIVFCATLSQEFSVKKPLRASFPAFFAFRKGNRLKNRFLYTSFVIPERNVTPPPQDFKSRWSIKKRNPFLSGEGSHKLSPPNSQFTSFTMCHNALVHCLDGSHSTHVSRQHFLFCF